MIEFEDFVSGLGTGGYVKRFNCCSFSSLTPIFRFVLSRDSWVASDKTLSWSFGYVQTASPHPLVDIRTWRGELRTSGETSITFKPISSGPGSTTSIVGYKVISNSDGGNGWWRTPSFPRFGKDLQELQVWARAGNLAWNKADYTVVVFFWERREPERMPRCQLHTSRHIGSLLFLAAIVLLGSLYKYFHTSHQGPSPPSNLPM